MSGLRILRDSVVMTSGPRNQSFHHKSLSHLPTYWLSPSSYPAKKLAVNLFCKTPSSLFVHYSRQSIKTTYALMLSELRKVFISDSFWIPFSHWFSTDFTLEMVRNNSQVATPWIHGPSLSPKLSNEITRTRTDKIASMIQLIKFQDDIYHSFYQGTMGKVVKWETDVSHFRWCATNVQPGDPPLHSPISGHTSPKACPCLFVNIHPTRLVCLAHKYSLELLSGMWFLASNWKWHNRVSTEVQPIFFILSAMQSHIGKLRNGVMLYAPRTQPSYYSPENSKHS